MPASDKEAFDLLYDMLKGYYHGLIEGALKVSGFFLIVAGWLLTSQATLSHLRESAVARYSALTLILLAHALYLLVAVRAFLLSRSTYRLMGELNYMTPKYYDNHRIRGVTVAVWYGTNLVITAGIIALILSEAAGAPAR